MRTKRTNLEIRHCKEALRVEIQIGSAVAHDKKRKQFVFHVCDNEYRILHNGICIESGQSVEELMEVYNEL